MRAPNLGRVTALGATTLALVFLASAGVAWACVPQAKLVTVHPRSSGPPGTEVTVSVLGFDPGRSEIRWNAVDGPLLGSANGPDFSASVAIPAVADGLYHLIVLSRSSGGMIGNTSSVSFQVVSVGGDTPTPRQLRGPALADGAVRSPSLSTGAVALAAGTGASMALVCVAGLGVARRRRRARPPLPEGTRPDGPGPDAAGEPPP